MIVGCLGRESTTTVPIPAGGGTPSAAPAARVLFDGRSLDGWRIADAFDFKRHGLVRVEDGAIVLGAGEPGCGIAWTGEMPRREYELSLEARRLEGRDFFCGLTFPVAASHCSLILGGWGGGTTGLSNVDGVSAEENETSNFLEVEDGRWYRVRLRVADGKVAAWIDDRQIVDLATEGRRLEIWWEQEPMRPLGIASWHTTAAVRNIELRDLRAGSPQ
jgi:hypothetical protein